MAKKYKSTDRFVKPDARFKSKLVTKFINCIMQRGKKTTAQNIVYKAIGDLEKKIKEKDPLDIFTTAVNNVKPLIEVRSRRIGGATYQVPVEVSPKRQQSLAMRWIITATKKKKGKPMAERLADELMAAFKGTGEAMTTRENVHKMAEANKAFAHFAYQ
ncbi:MAG: 30S ribosomal protein S7 [Planctomycetes bacterium RBG_16_59_8]|nr:MAG: 30S ribosomal protein S7 [Planctomycetes bacterium RBG_16_59_8]